MLYRLITDTARFLLRLLHFKLSSPRYHLSLIRIGLCLDLLASGIEYTAHIHCGPAETLITQMGVNVRRGLVVRVAHDLHGNQRVDASLVQQRYVVVAEVVRGDHGFQIADRFVGPVLLFLLFPVRGESAILHQAQPDSLKAVLAPRLTIFGMEEVFRCKGSILLQQRLQFFRDRYKAISGCRLQCAILSGRSHIVNVTLYVHPVLLEVDVAPFQAKGFTAPETEVIQHCQEHAVLLGPDDPHYLLPLPGRQGTALIFLLGLRADHGYRRITLDDAVRISVLEDVLEDAHRDVDLGLARSLEGIDEDLDLGGCDTLYIKPPHNDIIQGLFEGGKPRKVLILLGFPAVEVHIPWYHPRILTR